MGHAYGRFQHTPPLPPADKLLILRGSGSNESGLNTTTRTFWHSITPGRVHRPAPQFQVSLLCRLRSVVFSCAVEISKSPPPSSPKAPSLSLHHPRRSSTIGAPWPSPSHSTHAAQAGPVCLSMHPPTDLTVAADHHHDLHARPSSATLKPPYSLPSSPPSCMLSLNFFVALLGEDGVGLVLFLRLAPSRRRLGRRLGRYLLLQSLGVPGKQNTSHGARRDAEVSPAPRSLTALDHPRRQTRWFCTGSSSNLTYQGLVINN